MVSIREGVENFFRKFINNGQFDVSESRYYFNSSWNENYPGTFEKLTENIKENRTCYKMLPLPKDVDLIYTSSAIDSHNEKNFELQLVRARDGLPIGKPVSGTIFKCGSNDDYYKRVNEMRMRAYEYYERVRQWEADKAAGKATTEWPKE